MNDHPSHPPFSHEPMRTSLRVGTTRRDANLLCRVGVSGIVLLLFGGSGIVGRSGSGGGSSSVVGAGMVVVGVGCNDGGLAGGFELLEGLLEERGGVLGGAATFHVGGHVGPEAGGEGVFDFFLGEKEMLMLLGGMVG